MQIHGGNGFALEYPVSRVLCDARILNIFEGAAEIHAQVIARRLLEGLGYGGSNGPVLELGIGLDYGEAFVGNIGGKDTVSDFTAVGDVVNTTSRLQACARSGEVMVSERLALFLEEPAGPLEHVTVKGKHEPVAAQRVRWFDP